MRSLLVGAPLPMAPRTLAIVGVSAAAVLAGCGGAGRQTKPPPSVPSQPAIEIAGHGAKHGGVSGSDAPVVALPGLGELSYRCDSTGQQVASTLTDGPTAYVGASVTVEGNHGVHLHPRTAITGLTATRTTPFGSYHSLTWRIIVTDEPRTVVVTVRLHFHVGFVEDHGQTVIDCALSTFEVSGRVIEHNGRWSNPSPWA